ncbi:hypothetical protein GJAV_G00143670 [Gymnothorax javanicus]|nr:hypothetical protein GJAV_G00143670 [Gymnothorax javanicus]
MKATYAKMLHFFTMHVYWSAFSSLSRLDDWTAHFIKPSLRGRQHCSRIYPKQTPVPGIIHVSKAFSESAGFASMALSCVMPVLAVLLTLAAPLAGEDNELDYGYWNYREGSDNVNVASVRSITRVLDVWGKRIFNEIKHLLHSQPTALLPDYSRVRPLSESLNDLFREVSLLQRRISELSNRLATLEPYLRRHGYRAEGEEEGGGRNSAADSVRVGGASLSAAPPRHRVRVLRPKSPVIRRRRVKVVKSGGVRVPKQER